MTGAAGPGLAQGSKRRLFLAWTVWMWVAWLSSGEIRSISHVPSLLLSLLSPGRPQAGNALLAALRALAAAGLTAAALAAAGGAILRFIGARGEAAGREPLVLRVFPAARLLRLAAGIPMLALLAQGLGLAGLASRGVLAAVVALAALPALVRAMAGIRKPGLHRAPGLPGESRGLSAAVWCTIAITGIAALAPEVAWDAMVYHLRVPSLYLLAHKVYPIPEIFPSYFPFNGEMLLMLARNLGGDPAARLLHAVIWLACGVGTARLAGRLWGPAAVPWGLGLSLTIPLGMVVSSRAYVEFFLVLPFIGATLLLPDNRGGPPGGKRLLLLGFLAGSMAGTKYLGAAAAAVLGLWVLSRLRRGPARGMARAALLMLAGLLAAAGWWYLRNLLWTGNPVYPLLFGGPRWTPADMIGWKADASALTFSTRILLTGPWFLMTEPAADGGIPPVLLSAAAVPILWKAGRSRAWALAGALFILWWLTSPLTRYLAPALALASAAAAGCITGRGMGPDGERWLSRTALASCWLSVTCGFASIQFSTEPFGVATGRMDARAYRARRLAPAGAPAVLERLGELVPPGRRAYVMGYAFAYDVPRRTWFDFLYLRSPLYWWLEGTDDPARILVRARQAGLTHLAWHPLGGRVFHGRHPELMDWTPRKLKAWEKFWRANVREEAKTELWHIFELTPGRGNNPAPGPSLPGTEAVTGPIDRALDDGRWADAERMTREALARYPSFSRWLSDRLSRAQHHQQSVMPLREN